MVELTLLGEDGLVASLKCSPECNGGAGVPSHMRGADLSDGDIIPEIKSPCPNGGGKAVSKLQKPGPCRVKLGSGGGDNTWGDLEGLGLGWWSCLPLNGREGRGLLGGRGLVRPRGADWGGSCATGVHMKTKFLVGSNEIKTNNQGESKLSKQKEINIK